MLRELAGNLDHLQRRPAILESLESFRWRAPKEVVELRIASGYFGQPADDFSGFSLGPDPNAKIHRELAPGQESLHQRRTFTRFCIQDRPQTTRCVVDVYPGEATFPKRLKRCRTVPQGPTLHSEGQPLSYEEKWRLRRHQEPARLDVQRHKQPGAMKR